MATSTHNKYVSIPDWFSSSSSTPITSTEKPANITNVYYGGGSGGGTTGITEIPIDNKTIVWQDQVITVPIDNDKIIINTEGKITTSGTTGVWELRQLTDGTNYIYTTYPVVTQLGITMYAGTDGLDLGSIYDGLPIDNATIYWDLDENGNKILKAVGSSGGVADSVAWANVTGKPDWLLDGKIQYTEIEGIPDLSGFITKDYIDGKFVTFDLNETIDGIKTFTNGIKIGTSLINQSQNDVIYIDANLVVRGGITMYATGTVDIPSILDSLPVAGTESKGIASFDSSYFSVTNGKVTLLADNVGLNESELAEYLNTNNYAKKSDIPSLNGYATQSWVESKCYALNSDLMSLTTKVDDFLEGSDTDTIINKWLELEAFLSGLSESDNLATILSAKADKDYVDDTFVTLTTTQTITGEKNFTGGLKVNGSPIYYDTEKKYWKFEGDLLVTGGVTMYGSDSSFTPSTIMDAIAVDGTTISKDGGVLKVIGGTGGGVADSVAWGNITGKPTWIGSSKPSYSYSEITGAISTTELQNYLTQNSYLNVTSGDNRYLQLSGGTMSASAYIVWKSTEGGEDYSAYNLGIKLLGYNTNTNNYRGGIHVGTRYGWQLVRNGYYNTLEFRIRKVSTNTFDVWKTIAFTDSNVASATKLQTPRTIWGQPFDGTGNVSGDIGNTSAIAFDTSRGAVGIGYLWTNTLGMHMDMSGLGTEKQGTNLTLTSSGNVGIGTASPAYKLHVEGTMYGDLKMKTPRTIWGQSFDGTGNVDGDFIQHKYGAYGGNGSEFNIYNKAVADVDGSEGSLRWVFENAYARFRRLEIWSQNGATSTLLAYFSNSAWSFYTGIGDSMFCGGHAEGYALYVGSRISDANKYLFTVKYGQSTLGVGGNTALYVRGDGNVGVNTDSARCKFSVISVGTGSNPSLGALATVNTIGFGDNAYKTYFWTRGTGNGYIQVGREDGNTTAYNLILQALGGNVGIGKEDPQHKVDIVGNIMVSSGWYRSKGAYGWYSEDYAGGWYMTDAAWIRNYNSKPLLLEIGTNNTNGIGGHRVGLTLRGASHCSIMMIGTNGGSGYGWGIAANADGNFYVGRRTGESVGYSSTTDSYKFRLDGSGNGLFYGGVTMYSDQRKKTILNHVELSLKDIANAPLIEHYYNGDDKKTTHVGSIAQYWANMNDWFCKLDSEGFYTMEIQNAALASAISIARELDRYETKTDKAIKKLKKRICELEEEVERLKSA